MASPPNTRRPTAPSTTPRVATVGALSILLCLGLVGFVIWLAGAQLSKRFDKVWVGAYLRYDTLRGAVFDGSPLVATQTYWAGGFGFAWVLGVSKERVVIDRARL